MPEIDHLLLNLFNKDEEGLDRESMEISNHDFTHESLHHAYEEPHDEGLKTNVEK